MRTLVPRMLLTLARSNAMHSTHELTLHAHMPGQSSAEASAEAQAVASGGGKATANAVSEVGEDVRMMRSERWMEASSLFTTESDPAKARCVKDAACPHRVTLGTCKHTCEHTHTRKRAHTESDAHRPWLQMDPLLLQLPRHLPTPLG